MRRALVPLLAALVVALPCAAPALAAPGTPVQSDTIGGDGDGLPSLDHPTAVQATNAGDLAITTTGGGVRFATSGQLLQSPAPAASTAAYYVDGTRASYRTVTGSGLLSVMDAAGNPVVNLNPGSTETSLALDPASPYYENRVLYGLHDSSYVDVIWADATDTSLGGALAGGFPVRGSVQVVVAADHSLYLLAAGGDLLYHYTQQGIYLGATQLAVPGESAGSLDPRAIAIDGQGTLFVADYLNRRVVEFTLGGSYLGMFGDTDTDAGSGTPPGPGRFDGPTSVSVDCLGRLWLLDVYGPTSTGRVVRLDGVAAPTGTCAAEPAVKRTAAGYGLLATDRAGNTWTAGNGQVYKTDVNGVAVTHWGSTSSLPGQTGAFGLVGGLAVRPGGNVLVGSYRFLQQQPNGDYSTVYGTPKIIERRSAGAFVKEWTDPTWITAPVQVAVRPSDGEVFVANTYDKTATVLPHLEEFTSSFVHVRTIALPDLGGTGPTSVASQLSFNADGDLLLAVSQRTGVESGYYGFRALASQVVKVVAGNASTTSLFPGPANLFSANSVTSVLQLPDDTWVLGAFDAASQLPNTGALLTLSANGVVQRHVLERAVGDLAITRAVLDCRGRLAFFADSSTAVATAPWVSGKACTWKATAVTGSLVSHTTTTLKVRGYSNPASQVTKLRVLYGATAAHGKATAWITLPSDNVQLYRDVTITGLLTKHTYHYAVQVVNAAGTVTGADRVATTL